MAYGELGVSIASSLDSRASRLVRSIDGALGFFDVDNAVVDEVLLLLLVLPVVVVNRWALRTRYSGVVDPLLLLSLLATSFERLDYRDKVGPSRVVLVDEREKM